MIFQQIPVYTSNKPYFKSNTMKKTYLLYFAILVSSILLIINISALDFNDLQKGPYTGIIGNTLLILAMIVTLRDLKV